MIKSYDKEDTDELTQFSNELIFENEELKLDNQKLQDELTCLKDVTSNALYLLDKVVNNFNRI